MSSLVLRLNSWLVRRCSSTQWMIDRHSIQQQPYQGLRPRALLARDLCLHFSLSFDKIPAGKRNQALQQQLLLLSPFTEPGHYVGWQGGRAQLWLWDQAALRARLPACDRYSIVPDSALSLAQPLADGERLISGLHGCEWQRWQNQQLLDSRWQAKPDAAPLPLDLTQRTPLQVADRQLLQQMGLGACAALLLALLLVQSGAWLDLDLQKQALQAQLSELENDNALQIQARNRAVQAKQRWLSRQGQFGIDQSQLIAKLTNALPESSGLWQRYDYQPGRLQIFLRDPKPDPRNYVQRLDATGLLTGVQVQLEQRNDMVTLQAIPKLNGSTQ
jgi:hypothetical protein